MRAGGYVGMVLRVNLTTGELTSETYPEGWARRYLGGRGFGVAVMINESDPAGDPFSPDNPLVFATGPLTGSGIPLGARYDVVTKSPLTGTITSANSGGRFGTELKRAGYDAVIITGAAVSPVVLSVRDNTALLHDASAYWGMTTRETSKALQQDLGDPATKVAAIGPAGERLCRMSCIINDGGRAAGRGGVGAVMGAKRLKAIAVRGEGKIYPADTGLVADVKVQVRKRLKESGLTTGGLHLHGTATVVPLVNELGILPTCNFQRGRFEGAEKVSGTRMTETILTRRTACYACIVGCGRYTSAGGDEGEGPEYETIWAFGPNCGIDNLERIAQANYLCNDLGLDTISTGATIACAMEMAEKGYIEEYFRFGDSEALGDLVRMIGLREGIGDLLAEGSFRFAERFGHPELSMSVKRQELPGYDPRGLQGLGLNYATSVRGGCHVYGNMGYPEMTGFPERLDPYSTEGKADWTKKFQDLAAVIDSAGICMFTAKALWISDFVSMIAAVTGFNLDRRELLLIGERIWNLQRLFNIRAGIGSSDDTLPLRLRTVPLGEGPGKGQVWKREALLGEYYHARGWDGEGIPTISRLKELDIGHDDRVE